MSTLLAFHHPDGRIWQLHKGPEHQQSNGGHPAVLSRDPDLYNGEVDDLYVDVATETVRRREPCPGDLDRPKVAADGTDTATISGLPEPCGVEVVSGQTRVRRTVEDGVIEIAVDTPATYEVTVEAWPHLPTTFRIEAVAP